MKIAIVGLGVIGGGFALALKRAGGHEVYGIDVSEATRRAALERGLVVRAEADGKALLGEMDLTLLAVYPSAVLPFLQEHAPFFRPGAIVTDVTGVKTKLLKDLRGVLPPSVDFVPGHPMAGREKQGLDYASSEVFQGANYILTPLPENSEEHLKTLEALIRNLGFQSVSRVSPEFHDEIIAFTSQLPHAMAVALINSDREGRDTARFIGDSYRDLTRIAKINAPLWSELFLDNRRELLKALDGFSRELNSLRQALESGDQEALLRMFTQSSKRREQLDR